MFLKTLKLCNYGVFENAEFDLRTDVDHPLVLVTGNNGAGKTSMLEALRLALHGRRAFDTPIGEAEYCRSMAGRFRNGNTEQPCSVSLTFDYVDQHTTRAVNVRREWVVRRDRVTEVLSVALDDELLEPEDAEDLLATILPPEVARYFFFDGERIREMAEWGIEDESALFQAVGDLLGLGVLDQLRLDLMRLLETEAKGKRGSESTADKLEAARADAKMAGEELKVLRVQSRKLRGALDRARTTVKRIGALQSSEIAIAQERLGSLTAERKALLEEFERSAHDILPLLCAKTLRRRFANEIESRLKIEEHEIVSGFIDKNKAAIRTAIKAERLQSKTADAILASLRDLARGPKLAAAPTFQDISRSDATWMQRIIERELPDLKARSRVVQERLHDIEHDVARTEERLRRTPHGDPAAERALVELEERQREFLECEKMLEIAAKRVSEADAALHTLEQLARANRQEQFRAGRLAVRGQMMRNVLNALPVLASRMQASKETRFAGYLQAALNELWHKNDRLTDVRVSFAERRIELFDANGVLRKADLSAGEKQLFAIAFIYALAQLSGSRMPLVIDTPLGRLDKEHRRRFAAEFLPMASHQVVMLSTDTEIVGSLYEDVKNLLASHHELANYNGAVTDAVSLAESA